VRPFRTVVADAIAEGVARTTHPARARSEIVTRRSGRLRARAHGPTTSATHGVMKRTGVEKKENVVRTPAVPVTWTTRLTRVGCVGACVLMLGCESCSPTTTVPTNPPRFATHQDGSTTVKEFSSNPTELCTNPGNSTTVTVSWHVVGNGPSCVKLDANRNNETSTTVVSDGSDHCSQDEWRDGEPVDLRSLANGTDLVFIHGTLGASTAASTALDTATAIVTVRSDCPPAAIAPH
jgi:hypothetical protein